MDAMTTLLELLRYGDRANEIVMTEVCGLSATQLDRPLDLGMGSVRKIASHLLAGEVTWLARLGGNVEAKWPAKPIPEDPAAMLEMFRAEATARKALIIGPADLDRRQQYRDSRGSLFEASLQDMLIQMVVHATHHRAQLVNAIRRVGGDPLEVDYMQMVRRAI